MRVAVVTESFLPTVNGVTNSVAKVLDHLRMRGHDALVLCPRAGSPREYAGFPVHELPAASYRQFPVGVPSPAVARELARFQPDIVHAASPFWLGAHTMLSARRIGVPSVAIFQTDIAGYTVHNRLAATQHIARWVIRAVHAQADLTLLPSSVSTAELRSMGVTGPIERWGRGVDTVRYHPRMRGEEAARRIRSKIAPRGETIVGYIGRLAPEKQVERLAALRGLQGISLLVVGDGPSRKSVRHALRGMPVHYTGALHGADLAAAYAAMDVFVHAGCEETFGQTIQEAHATGIPVVCARAGGPIDLVNDGDDGFLFSPGPSGDAELRAFVRVLAGDDRMRAAMGEAGRRKVVHRTWEAVCDDLLGHYRSVIDEHAARVAPVGIRAGRDALSQTFRR